MNINHFKAQIESIRGLIAESRIPEAIQSFIALAKTAGKPELRDELISISAQQRKLETDTRKYISDASEIEMRQNRLLGHLLDLLSDVESGQWVEEDSDTHSTPRSRAEKPQKKAFPISLVLLLAALAIATAFLLYHFSGRKPNTPANKPDACLALKREASERNRLGDYDAALKLLNKALESCDDKQEVEDLISRVKQRMEEHPARPDEQQQPHGPRVTAIRLQAGPADFSGDCPQEIVFLGRITADGPGTVSYRFMRSDGAQGPIQQLTFKGAGTEPVRTTWRLGASGKVYNRYWQVLKVLEPNEMESNKAYFNLKCR